MAQLASYGTCFGPTNTKAGGSEKQAQWVKFVADFSSDNTAVGTDDEVFIADHNLLIEDFYADVETAVSSSESTSLLSLGVGSGGTNIMGSYNMNSFLVNSLIGAGSTNAGKYPISLTRGQKAVLNKTGATTLSAGKLHLNFKVRKRTDY